MSRPVVRFGYDIASPFSFIGYEILKRYEQFWDIDVVLEPVLLAGVLHLSGNTPPLKCVPLKAKWAMKDVIRAPKVYGMKPLIFREGFPHNTLLVMRVLTAVKRDFPEKLDDVTRRLFTTYWHEGKDVFEKSVLVQLLDPMFSALGPKMVHSIVNEAAMSPAIREMLRTRTTEAVEKHGMFGAPTFWVRSAGSEEEEMVFGSDRLDHVAYLLGKEWMGPLGPTKGWMASKL